MPDIDNQLSNLTTKQQRFVEEYCVDFNATQAAVRAGYSKASARDIGYENLTKPDISAAIKQRIESLIMTSEEAAKLIGDIARSSLNDFLVVQKVQQPTTQRQPLAEIIQALEQEIAFEEQYARRANLTGNELKAHKTQQQKRQRTVLRYQIELEHNPAAFRQMPGEPIEVEQAVLDLVALAKAKEGGRIKSLSFNEHGPRVELYAADANAAKILEYHGKIKAPGESTNVIIFKLPDNGR